MLGVQIILLKIHVKQIKSKTAGRLVPDSESAIRWMEKGYKCLSYSGDIWIMQNAILEALSDIKSHIYNEKREVQV